MTVDLREARRRRWLRPMAVAALIALFGTELVLGWDSLAAAFGHLRAPHPGWLTVAVIAEVAAMGAYARMQRRLLRSAGIKRPIWDHVALAYAAHSLSVTLPGGPAFSTRFNYQQMIRFGATPAIASWCIALSGILSATALAAVTTVGALTAGGATHWEHLAGLAVAVLLLVIGIRRVVRRPERLSRPLALVNRIRRRPAQQGGDRLHTFIEQLRAARLHPGHGAAAATFAVLNWVFDAMCLWLCCRAVGDAVGLNQVLLAFCAAMAAGTITIIPGGLGLIDSALVLGLLAGGVPTSTAIAAVVLYRIISFGFIIGLGWISWLVIRHRAVAAPATPNGGRSTADHR
ncbi:lysylphosphatidylglycerol synthase transmembrane domain-containing protein [Paractinoplanes durhamensis]|uniref:Membrane protein n=1 Tax=Paractinoplanes durhamensis TaxID=113563 RepID=A0ABQ3YR30_9ACTN|nr:YbhN family protein [Actinoplanes durhamensis]GIE00047.1 membrane protein [Actinoplanes durhamensis]